MITHFVSGKKKEPKPKLLVRIPSGGVGVFHVKGWGPKSSVCPSNPSETKIFGRMSRDFCRDIPGVPEKFEKKKFVFNSHRLTFLSFGNQFNFPITQDICYTGLAGIILCKLLCNSGASTWYLL